MSSSAFGIGAKRTALQDLRFLIDELVEIAARALSPGVNDPFTAVTCLDWLGAAVSELAGREIPSPLRTDEDGALRVIAHPESFGSFLDRSFGALAQYCASDMVAALRYVRALGEVALKCDNPSRLRLISDYADKLEELAAEALNGFNLARVADRAAERTPGWTIPVVRTIAQEAQGIAELAQAIEAHRDYLRSTDRLARLEHERALAEIRAGLEAEMVDAPLRRAAQAGRLDELADAVATRRLSAADAARIVERTYYAPDSPGGLPR